MSDIVDVVVLGAGPAGLAAGVAVLELGGSVVVVERGSRAEDRDRSLAPDLVTGIGGAGLYSDGKFLFAPSATELWRLKPEEALREAYEWTAGQLREEGLDAPPFESRPAGEISESDGIKRYPSHYMPLENRLRLIRRLERRLNGHLVTKADGRVQVDSSGVEAIYHEGGVRARAAVIASGRFGPLRSLDGVGTTFRRVEVGMRIEQNADEFALDRGPLSELRDPKWIRRSGDERLEWRTFCCCRRGEVLTTEFGDLVTVSGRADGPATTKSNFGLNVRFLDAEEGKNVLARVVAAASYPPLQVNAAELLGNARESSVAERYGEVVAQALVEGMKAFEAEVGVDLSSSRLHLPAVEGVGYYPAVDEGLMVAAGVRVAGDAAGIFRGLTPALVSGRFAARQAYGALPEI